MAHRSAASVSVAGQLEESIWPQRHRRACWCIGESGLMGSTWAQAEEVMEPVDVVGTIGDRGNEVAIRHPP